MEKNDKTLIAVLLTVIAVVLIGICMIFLAGRNNGQEKSKEPEEKTIEDMSDGGLPEDREKTKPAEAETAEENESEVEEPILELNNLPDCVLENLGVTREQISEALIRWNNENGYYTSSGAVFDDEIKFKELDKVHSVSLTLLFPDEDASPAEDVTITMDVFEDRQLVSFHK